MDQNSLYGAWESRKETLTILFKRLLESADKLLPDEAVVYTNPLADTLLIRYSHLENFHKEQATDELINKTLSGSDND